MPNKLWEGVGGALGGLLGKGRTPEPPPAEAHEAERRVSNRVALRIPVRACLPGRDFKPSRILDINLRGLAVEALPGAKVGDSIALGFTAIPDVCGPFTVRALAVRLRPSDGGLGLRVDRERSSPENVELYRKLVLFYLRHKPLPEKVSKGFFEGRCAACGWIGRVGMRSPVCSRCGRRVVPVTR